MLCNLRLLLTVVFIRGLFCSIPVAVRISFEQGYESVDFYIEFKLEFSLFYEFEINISIFASFFEFRKLSDRLSLGTFVVKSRVQTYVQASVIINKCCWLPDPFGGIGAWRKTMEPQKLGNSPGSGPEVVKKQRVAKE